MMKINFFTLLPVVAILACSVPSGVSAQFEKGFCYDRIGDEQFCFHTENKCESQQKDDHMAESPCYNEDRE